MIDQASISRSEAIKSIVVTSQSLGGINLFGYLEKAASFD